MTGNTYEQSPHLPPSDKRCLGFNLIEEELRELNEAYAKSDITGIADALGDLLYVVLWNADLCGIDLEPVFKEVHRSNMTKLWTGLEVACMPDGSTATAVRSGSRFERTLVVKRADGKVIKSPSYEPANIAAIIKKQMQ